MNLMMQTTFLFANDFLVYLNKRKKNVSLNVYAETKYNDMNRLSKSLLFLM